jgi:hypothetical protein
MSKYWRGEERGRDGNSKSLAHVGMIGMILEVWMENIFGC